MSELLMAEAAWTLIAKQKIMPNDIIILCQDAFPNGVQTSNDVATLLALETACDAKCPQWDDFFITTISKYMVHKSGQPGVIDAKQCDWIKRSVTRNGLIGSSNEFELILQILELAESGPSDLCALVLDHLCHKVYEAQLDMMGAGFAGEHDMTIVYLKRTIAVASKFSIHERLRAEGLLDLLLGKGISHSNSEFTRAAKDKLHAA